MDALNLQVTKSPTVPLPPATPLNQKHALNLDKEHWVSSALLVHIFTTSIAGDPPLLPTKS